MISKRDASPVRSKVCKAKGCTQKLACCTIDGCEHSICAACTKKGVVHCLDHTENLFYEERLSEEWKQKGLVYNGAIDSEAIVAAILADQPDPNVQFNDKVYLYHTGEMRFRIKDNKKFVHKKSCSPAVPSQTPIAQYKVNPTFSF